MKKKPPPGESLQEQVDEQESTRSACVFVIDSGNENGMA